MAELDDLLMRTVESKATDLHIIAGLPPLLRINTVLKPIEGHTPMKNDQIEALVKHMFSKTSDGRDLEKKWEMLVQKRDLDISYHLSKIGRFRVNVHFQRDSIAIAFRVIPRHIPTFEELNLPEVISRFANLPRGLVLVTGETGSGKSTTMASMIDYVNHRYRYHIITIEDPIEYLFKADLSAIEQRELGSDVMSFSSGLKHVLRQDPDVILVGEMRDLETISSAITAAETGHLVLSTLHTNSAAASMERIIDVFPAGQQSQVRTQLANTLEGVISQVLFPRIDEPGLVPATEIMVATSAVRNCIRDNRLHEIPNIIKTNRAAGMHTLDSSIKDLVLNGKISREAALGKAVNPEAMLRVV